MTDAQTRSEPEAAEPAPETVTPAPLPSISVVVCSHDRLHYVRACMESLGHQTVGRHGFETILVDSGSPPTVAAEMKRIADETPNTRLVRLDISGVSLARNEGARAATGDYVAYIDDDAMAMPDWIEQIQHVLAENGCRPAVLGGKVLPVWEAPLPRWWPASLRGVLSIIEHEGSGEYRTAALPAALEPYGVNMILRRDVMLQHGGFAEALGRMGLVLQSDEEVQLAWRLQDAGCSAIYDSRVVVRHSIQAKRFNPEWLLARLYWQGASTVRTRRLLGQSALVWRDFPRRLLVEALTLPFTWLVSKHGTRLMALRWRHAYACGFTRETLSCGPGKRAVLLRRKERGPC
jgi:glycosyltransferase involved in cell wall biosynthesis